MFTHSGGHYSPKFPKTTPNCSKGAVHKCHYAWHADFDDLAPLKHAIKRHAGVQPFSVYFEHVSHSHLWHACDLIYERALLISRMNAVKSKVSRQTLYVWHPIFRDPSAQSQARKNKGVSPKATLFSFVSRQISRVMYEVPWWKKKTCWNLSTRGMLGETIASTISTMSVLQTTCALRSVWLPGLESPQGWLK